MKFKSGELELQNLISDSTDERGVSPWELLIYSYLMYRLIKRSLRDQKQRRNFNLKSL